MKAKDRLPVFSERLRQVMEEKGLSIMALSSLTGIAQPSLSMYRNGNRLPDAEVMARLCRALNVSADWLLGLPVAYAANVNARVAAAEYVDLPLKVVDQLRNGTAHVYSDALITLIINRLSETLNADQEKGANNGNL